MDNASINQNEELKYSKFLSSLFCSSSIIVLSILSLLNNLSIDFYSMVSLLKIVLPASFCFWFIGFVIGRILDSLNKKIIKEQIKQETEAYEMPSMFAGDSSIMEDDFGVL
ncbi:MAG: hypothetical protein IJB79_04620 [Candidatus Gastranaerophilales bacterium]|nr:hypothetical protein [Candidatus Gastranaerophilales bacterium]